MNDFVVLNGNEQELWEIDYEKIVAFNISELKIVENEMTKYVGTIEDYLRGNGFTKSIFTKQDHFLRVLIMALNKNVHLNNTDIWLLLC